MCVRASKQASGRAGGACACERGAWRHARARARARTQGLEKYLLTKLYDRTFGVDPADRERDQAIGLRLQALQFIRPEHLEVAREFANDAALLLAQKELAKINMFKASGWPAAPGSGSRQQQQHRQQRTASQ